MFIDSIHYINQNDHWENVCPEINMAHNKSWKWKPCHKWTANWLPISNMNEGHGILWSKSSSVADGKELNEASSYQIGPSHSANQQASCQELRTSNLDYRNTTMTMPVSHGCHFKAKVTAYQPDCYWRYGRLSKLLVMINQIPWWTHRSKKMVIFWKNFRQL